MNRKIAEKLIRGWFKEPVLSAEDELTKALDTAEQRGREELWKDIEDYISPERKLFKKLLKKYPHLFPKLKNQC